MKSIYLNILGVIVGLCIINIPPFILDAMIDEMNMENFGYIGAALGINVFLSFLVSQFKIFPWLKRVWLGLLFISFISLIFNYSILNRSSEISKSIVKLETSKKAKSLDEIQSSEPYELNTNIVPDFNARGEASIITDKKRKFGADYYVLPIQSKDSIEYFFGIRIMNSLMEIPYDFRIKMIESDNRFAIIQQDTNYKKAIENFKLNVSKKVSKNAKVFYVYDINLLISYYNSYLFWTFGVTNGLYFIALIIMNMKLKRSEETLNIE